MGHLRRVLLASAGAIAMSAAGPTTLTAAGLGQICCADLEARVVELEALTARKGNRRLSLTVSGAVTHVLLYWNDGTQRDVYIADQATNSSRFRFVGNARLGPEWLAGFLYEFGFSNNLSGAVNQFPGGDDLGLTTLLRVSTVFLQHEKLGRITIGHGSTPTDGIVTLNLSGAGTAASANIPFFLGGFVLRANSGELASNPATNWAAALRAHDFFNLLRRNLIRYDSPSLAGVVVSAAVAEDNFWDLALRYADTLGPFRVLAGIGVSRDQEFNALGQPSAPGLAADTQAGRLCAAHCATTSDEIKGSLSILHGATGLFANFGGARRELSGGHPSPGSYSGPAIRFGYLSLGIARNFFEIGNTVLYGEYGVSRGGLAQAAFLASTSAANCGLAANTHQHDCTADSRVTEWGLGLLQHIDAASLELFLTYRNLSLDATGFAGTNAVLNRNTSDLQVVIAGTRIRF